MNTNPIAGIVRLFESLAVADIQRLRDFYADDAYFKDPFNEVRGVAAIQRVFLHMFETLEEPRFIITRRMADRNECWLAWEFRFRIRSMKRGQAQVVRGASHLLLTADGRIASHRDYWDAAEELYEKLPVVGALMRWMKRRAAS